MQLEDLFPIINYLKLKYSLDQILKFTTKTHNASVILHKLIKIISPNIFNINIKLNKYFKKVKG